MQTTTKTKKIRDCFLFQTHCDTDRKRLFWAWNFFFLVASGIGTGLLSLLLAIGRYPWHIFFGYFRHPLIALLNILPVVLLILLLYCLVGRAWIAFLVGSVPVMLASVGNYFKIVCRDDPFMFADVPDITTALGISERYDLSMNWRLGFCLFCMVFGTLFLFFFVRGRVRPRWRLALGAVILLSIIPLVGVYTSDDVYDNKTQNYEYADQWAAPQVFLTRGFVYPFLYSIKEAFPEPPQGYSEEAALEILESYTPQDIPEDKKVNVIGIQLEAFNDLERLGITGIAPEVYEKYHALEAESYTGNLITNIFAGGTVRTERAFLTGDVTLEDFRRDTGSYVWYFKDQGYHAEGIHPYHDYYYNRKNVNSYLGFDQYWFFQNRYDEINDGHIAMDDVLFPDLLQFYQNRDKDTPYFNFTVTYQGHGPYATDALEGTDGWWDGTYSDESTYYILNNYLDSVQETAGQLWDFIQALREDEDPVVVIAFGDHNPWLGYSNSAYHDLGVNLDTSTEEGFYNYYGTRYLIWANDAAKETLNNDFTGEGPDVSPCFLMNVLFEQCGWGSGSAYMQLTGEVMEQIPVINTDGFYVENGQVTTALSDTAQELFSRLEIAQFYRKQHSEW
ncbi:LTA synthase family protein [Dysosmobacter sp.]|uniref:LTA synthase family protein n=1 Tax=Dysosmobacter sp. TaxID=2591382 RepID=UPI003A8DEEF0